MCVNCPKSLPEVKRPRIEPGTFRLRLRPVNQYATVLARWPRCLESTSRNYSPSTDPNTLRNF